MNSLFYRYKEGTLVSEKPRSSIVNIEYIAISQALLEHCLSSSSTGKRLGPIHISRQAWTRHEEGQEITS